MAVEKKPYWIYNLGLGSISKFSPYVKAFKFETVENAVEFLEFKTQQTKGRAAKQVVIIHQPSGFVEGIYQLGKFYKIGK